MAEGEKVVRRLLDSPLTVVSVLVTEEWYKRLFHTEQPLFDIFIADKELLQSIVGYNLHQGIMAVAKVPEQQFLEVILRQMSEPYLFVALDGLVNAENVGVVVRNCAAFGVDAIIVGETSSSPYLRRAVRNSMGTVFQFPVVHTADLAGALQSLQKTFHTNIIAAHPDEQSTIHNTNFMGNTCIVFGNEGEGISDKILKVCSSHVAIPMMNGTDSLNVASASAVFLYEARKQRDTLAKV